MLELHRCLLAGHTPTVTAQDYGNVTGKQVVWRLVKIQLYSIQLNPDRQGNGIARLPVPTSNCTVGRCPLAGLELKP